MYYQFFSITTSQKSDKTSGFLISALSGVILQVKETDFGQILKLHGAFKLFGDSSLKVFQTWSSNCPGFSPS